MKDEDIKLPKMVNLTMREDWRNAIEEYARLAVRMNAVYDHATKERADAWLAVYEALNTAVHGWMGTEELPYVYAVKTILALAEKAAAEQPKPSDPEPFDLCRAMAGEPIVTRAGRKARFVAHVPEAEDYKVVAFVEGANLADQFTKDGILSIGSPVDMHDLFMAPKPKRTVWVNVWLGNSQNFGASAYGSKEKADRVAAGNPLGKYSAIAHPIEIDA